jgi:hypothetical protein
MTTLIATAAREDQCVTVEGYGFNGATASVCEVGAYSTGKTRNPCRACGSGLTTTATQSTGFAACVAPKGYYFDKNAAKPCPRGAYTAALGRATACTACAAGVTTAASASDDVSKCVYAKPGYSYTGPNAAAVCAKGYYQSAISQAAACTKCPDNMTTLKKGAVSSAACVALPGFSYDSASSTATACAVGSYKGGFNRRGCVQCGPGFTTTGTTGTTRSALPTATSLRATARPRTAPSTPPPCAPPAFTAPRATRLASRACRARPARPA